MRVATVSLVEEDGGLFCLVDRGCSLSEALDLVLCWRRVVDPCARFVFHFG